MRSNMKSYAFLNQILSSTSSDGITLALKSEIDFQQGRNEELRAQILHLDTELQKTHASLVKSEDELERLRADVHVMNATSGARDIFNPFKLPPGMSPSSQDVIAALNEYLIDTLQELDDYRTICGKAEKELESLKRKFSVAKHQLALLYREHVDETDEWRKERERLASVNKRLNDAIAVDAVKLQEYDRLLETLQHDEPAIRQRLAESSRQMCSLRASEKHLQRKCQALDELSGTLVKENKKLRVDVIEMEIAVRQRIGYLERYRDLANFRIASMQKQLEESVPVSRLEHVNREYTEVVANYRQLLDKQDRNEQLEQTLHVTEQLNRKHEGEIVVLKQELESAKDKINVLEETLERMKNFSIIVTNQNNTRYDEYESIASKKANASALNASQVSDQAEPSVLSMAKRLTAMEMKELNERQRADHAQRMYDQQRAVLRELENRNLEVEQNFKELTRKYLALEKSEQNLREQLAEFVPKAASDRDKEKYANLIIE
jgi:centrosomal protein CEP290